MPRRTGATSPSTSGSLTPEQAEQTLEVKEMVANPPSWLQNWSQQVGADLRTAYGRIRASSPFARENGSVYHTYHGVGTRPLRRHVSA
jgi:hypothetical protein